MVFYKKINRDFMSEELDKQKKFIAICTVLIEIIRENGSEPTKIYLTRAKFVESRFNPKAREEVICVSLQYKGTYANDLFYGTTITKLKKIFGEPNVAEPEKEGNAETGERNVYINADNFIIMRAQIESHGYKVNVPGGMSK